MRPREIIETCGIAVREVHPSATDAEGERGRFRKYISRSRPSNAWEMTDRPISRFSRVRPGLARKSWATFSNSCRISSRRVGFTGGTQPSTDQHDRWGRDGPPRPSTFFDAVSSAFGSRRRFRPHRVSSAHRRTRAADVYGDASPERGARNAGVSTSRCGTAASVLLLDRVDKLPLVHRRPAVDIEFPGDHVEVAIT